jgi:hypothetical protein
MIEALDLAGTVEDELFFKGHLFPPASAVPARSRVLIIYQF